MVLGVEVELDWKVLQFRSEVHQHGGGMGTDLQVRSEVHWKVLWKHGLLASGKWGCTAHLCCHHQ